MQYKLIPGGGGGGHLEIIGVFFPPRSSNPDPIQFQTKIFHTRFQTRPLKSILVFRPGL